MYGQYWKMHENIEKYMKISNKYVQIHENIEKYTNISMKIYDTTWQYMKILVKY